MSDLSPETPIEAIAEDTRPDEAPDPEEYTVEAGVSDSTGTIYEPTGEPEATPYDLEIESSEE